MLDQLGQHPQHGASVFGNELIERITIPAERLTLAVQLDQLAVLLSLLDMLLDGSASSV
jgi:hypothetical protein